MGCLPPPHFRSALHAAGGAGPGKVDLSFRPPEHCVGEDQSPQNGDRRAKAVKKKNIKTMHTCCLGVRFLLWRTGQLLATCPPFPSLSLPWPKLHHPRLPPFSIALRRLRDFLICLLCQHLSLPGAGFSRDTLDGNPISHGWSWACDCSHRQPPKEQPPQPTNDSLPKMLRPGPNVPPPFYRSRQCL